MRILYIGPEHGTSLQRMSALGRLGHDVTALDSDAFVKTLVLPPKLVYGWISRTGAFGLGGLIKRYVLSRVKGASFDLIFVDGGPLLGPATIRGLKGTGDIIVNYNADNPYVSRDRRWWGQFLRALPYYDLVATPRASSVEPALRAGARRVLAVKFAADEAAHRPIELSDEDRAHYQSKVAFVGTWMPERGPFLLRLVERGVPLRIYGDRWKKAPEYEKLKSHIASGALDEGRYVKAVRGASIALGLLSKGNEDLHTTRSLEIPAIGTLLCAERTSEHLAMYKDGEEAVFFDDAEECADLCLALLRDPRRIEKIAGAGSRRVRRNGDFNEMLLSKIIRAALNTEAPTDSAADEGKTPSEANRSPSLSQGQVAAPAAISERNAEH